MDGGAWWAAVHGVAKSRTGLSDITFTFHFPALAGEFLPRAPPGTLYVAQLVKNLPAMRETWVRSLGREDPLVKGNDNLL